MPFNVPEDQKPEFNKKVKGSLELLTAGVTDKLRQIELESADTLVEAYNQPISEAELTQVPPSDMVTVDPQMARRIEINSLRMPDGTIYRNANELFSKPVDFNKFQAIGFVDKEGNATPNGELFFNLKEAGMFNEDGTLTKKGQAYSMSERELEDEANLDAFTTLWDEEVIRPSATWDEQLEAAAGFVGNAFGGFTDLMQTFGKSISVKNAFDVLTGTPEGKKLEAEFQTNQLAAIEKITTNFANLGRLLDVGSAALADTVQTEDVAMVGPGGVPMYTQSVEALQQQNAEAERDLYAARQRQWKQNRDIQSFEVGQIAETVLGLDGAVKMAEDAKNTLGAEEFNKRYSRVGAFSELAFDPTNLIPASVAFNVAKSVPLASRLTLGAQKVLGRVAQTEAALADVQAVVQAGNAVLKKEALFVPRYQQLFKNMSAKAADNPELMVRANEVLDRAKQITASADEVRAAMPTAMNTLEELAVKRNSLATRIPEAYANKVMQTVELGRRIRSAPARTLSSMLERTGNTLTKVDDAVTGYLKDRGLDQAYNAALGASGVVGLAGNPVVGAIGVTGAALKSGKFLTEYGKILRYVGKEMENARGQIPFWKRVAAHTAPGSLGRGIAHTFNMFELGGATSDIIRRAGRGVAAAYPTDLFFEWLSDGADMRPQTMTQAAAESLVIGGSFAAAGGAFMGTNKRMRELSIGDEINFRQSLTDTKQKALYEALPPGVRRSMATYSIANPTLNYNFIDSGSSSYDINTNTANINVNSTNPLKPLVAHETLHHTLIKNNMEGGIAALFLGDTKTNAVGGLFRSKEGKLDPDFEQFKDGYYKRLRDAGMTDAEIGIEYPLDKIAVEYFIEQHADQYATMAETGELGALAARGEVRKKLGAVLETVLPKIPVLRDLHIKSGGAIDANGAWVKGNGILGDDKIRQNPIANRMFREMNRRSSGMMPGQFEPLISDKEGSGAPLMFDPANAIDMELMHPFIQVDENDKPILKDGRPVFIDKSVDIDRAMAGLTAMEAMRKRRESNYVPEKGEAFIDDEGDLQPGWLSDAVLNEMFAKHKFNNEQKRMIRQTNRLIKQGKGQRMVMINFPATTRLKSGKVVYAPQKAAIRDAVPVAMTISKDGNILYGLMSVTKLQENIKKRAQSKRGKKLYAGNIDAILQDVQAMMDFHLNRPTEDSIVYFNEKYGVVEGDQRKKFINTMFGLLNKKEQAVLNPMLLEDGVKSADNVYRTYRADRVSKAIPMAPEEYASMPFSYEAVSQVRMPEAQRAMPEGEQKPTRFMPEGVDEDKFYSQLERVITDKVPTRATAQQIINSLGEYIVTKTETIDGKDKTTVVGKFPYTEQSKAKSLASSVERGRSDWSSPSKVKDDEIKWSGIEQALASLEKDGKVSKDDLLNYLRNEGMVRFEEVTLGEKQQVAFNRLSDDELKNRLITKHDAAPETLEDVPREDLIAILEDYEAQRGEVPQPKYSKYVLPGGENYREVVLAMPVQPLTELPADYKIQRSEDGLRYYPIQVRFNSRLRDAEGNFIEPSKTEAEAKQKALDVLNSRKGVSRGEYTSSHFPDIPNYVAHMRTNERTLDDGSEGLFVEEFQSDRHQEGRKRGYDDKKENGLDVATREFNSIVKPYSPATPSEVQQLVLSNLPSDTEWARNALGDNFERIRDLAKQDMRGIQDAPFRTTWPLQLFKRALRDAVDGGKDWIGWTTGETQAERFNLSKQVKSIDWSVGRDGLKVVDIKPIDAPRIYLPVKNGKVYRTADRAEFRGKGLDEIIGKEVAQRIVDSDSGSLKGDGLNIGGQGMKGFYDNILPKEIGKYVDKFGGKVEKAEIGKGKSRSKIEKEMDAIDTSTREGRIQYTELAKMRDIAGLDQTPIWKVSITPEMRKISQTGQMRFMPEKLDSDYMKAVESGDVEAQQRMVDEAATANGMRVLYHGTTSEKAEQIKKTGILKPEAEPAVYFTTSEDGGGYGDGTVLRLAVQESKIEIDDEFPDGRQDFRAEVGYKGQLPIKSADPITRDDSGKVIPLSKRFDVGSRDMRYMPEGDVEVKVVDRPDETTEQGTPAPDSDVQSLPLTGNPIPWDRMLSRQVRFMPESDRNAFPTMTPKLLAEIEKETPTLAAIHIDRMRVGEYMGIDLQGGMFYPTIKENLDNGVVWAFNSTGVARTVANRAAQNKGYVKLVLMQEGNVVGNKTFANIWFKILSDAIENKQISKALALTELNAARRTVYKTLEGKDVKKNPWVAKHADKWNSLEEAKEAILSMPQIERGATYFKKSKTTTKSEGEKIAYQALLSQKMAKLGFPDARKIVNDIEEPAFKGIPAGAAVAIIKFDPLGADEKIMTAKEAGVPEHMSYGYVLKGKPVAKLGYYQVVEETFPKTKGQIMTQQHTDFPIRASVPSKKSARGQIQYASAIANASKLK